jgi:hypothetical protein
LESQIILKSLGSNKSKGLNRIAKIGWGRGGGEEGRPLVSIINYEDELPAISNLVCNYTVLFKQM